MADITIRPIQRWAGIALLALSLQWISIEEVVASPVYQTCAFDDDDGELRTVSLLSRGGEQTVFTIPDYYVASGGVGAHDRPTILIGARVDTLEPFTFLDQRDEESTRAYARGERPDYLILLNADTSARSWLDAYIYGRNYDLPRGSPLPATVELNNGLLTPYAAPIGTQENVFWTEDGGDITNSLACSRPGTVPFPSARTRGALALSE